MLKLLILHIFILSFVLGAVYEARNSDDVDFFLEHNPEKNTAILFYNSKEDIKEVNDNIDLILSIYKNVGEEGRAKEDWVDKLNDKVHIMKVDVGSLDNARIVKEFKVGQTPLVSLLEDDRAILEEVVDKDTFEHIKEIYVAQIKAKEKEEQEKKAKETENQEPTSSIFPDAEYTHNQQTPESQYESSQESIEAAKKAQEAAEAAKKAAAEALSSLKEAKKAFEKQAQLDKLKEEAENARKEAEKANKELEEAKKQIADHLAQDLDDSKKDSQGTNQNNNQNSANKAGSSQAGGNNSGQKTSEENQLTAPPGYTIDYIPVFKPIDQDKTQKAPSQQPVKIYKPTQNTQSQGYSILSNSNTNQNSGSASTRKEISRKRIS